MKLVKMLALICTAGLFSSLGYATSASVYHRYLPDKIITLDPTKSIERYSQSVILQIYDPLFKTEDGITPLPHIAESFSYDADTRTYMIDLRKDVHFHDDVQLTAEDVIFTIRRMCESKDANVTLLSLIEGCKTKGNFGVRKMNPFRITIQLTDNFPPFISLLASPHFMILPAKLHGRAEEEFFRQPVGTGPFRIASIDAHAVVLTGNRKYFRGPPDIGQLVYHTEPPERIYAMLRDSAIDDIFPLPAPERYPDRYVPVSVNQASSLFLAFRPSVKPYASKAFREAIRAAIDNRRVLGGLPPKSGIIPAHGIVPWGAIGFDSTIPESVFSPTAVQSLLRRAGYKRSDDVPPLIIHSALKDDLERVVPPALKASLESVGFKVRIIQQSLPDLMKDIDRGDVGMMLINPTMASVDTYRFLELWRANFPHPSLRISDGTFDAILDDALKTSDRIERSRLYKTANRILHTESHAHHIGHVISCTSLRAKGWRLPGMNFLGPFFYSMYDATYDPKKTDSVNQGI